MSATDDLLNLRLTLLRNGYCPLPLVGKRPLVKGWTKAVIDERWVREMLGTYRSYTNTGIRCDGLAMIDDDVLDPDLAFAIAAEATARFGKTKMIRVGKPPKCMMAYRLEGADIGKLTSNSYELNGKKAQVEILNGPGCQFAAFGVHPDTGKPFVWQGEPPRTPETFKPSDLPTVTAAQLRDFVAWCNTTIAEAGGVLKQKVKNPPNLAEKAARREAARLQREARVAASENPTIVERVLAKLDLEAVLVERGYKPDGGRYRHPCATGGAGAVILVGDDGVERVYSHNASDPLHRDNLPEWCKSAGANAIDTIAVLDYDGDRTKALSELATQLGIGAPAPRMEPEVEEKLARPAKKPVIQLRRGDIEGQADQAEAALVASGRGIYHRGGMLVCLGETVIATGNERGAAGVRIFPVGDHALVEHLTAAAEWRGYDGRAKQETTVDAPMTIARTLAQRQGRWKHIRPLRGVIHAPTLRPDGTLLDRPGYDTATGLLLDPRGAVFPSIPDSRADAEAALALLRELIGTFPFVGEEDRAVALSAILTACVRRSLPTAPLHGFTAPAAGTGKSKLVDIASVIATGREAGVIAQGSSEEEMQKRLGSMLLAGDAFVALDNCETPVGGEFLCQLLTQPLVRTRVLGRSETPELPADCFVAATGNNLRIVGDATRRAVLCRLDANVERPELRVFEYDPVEVAKESRGAYAAAALTIPRAYLAAGSPMGARPLGSFSAWSRWVRDALTWLGEADPVDTMALVRETDPDLEDTRAVFEQWREVIGTDRVAVREVIERATRKGGIDLYAFAHPDFREALLNVAGNRGAIDSRKLGEWLAARTQRIVAGFQIIQVGLSGGRQTWRLRRAG